MNAGEYQIKSNEIPGLDLKNKQVTFLGNAIIYGEDLVIEGEKIEGYKSADGTFSHVTVTGKPAQLVQQNTSAPQNTESQNKNIEESIKSLKLTSQIIKYNLVTKEFQAFNDVQVDVVMFNQTNPSQKNDKFFASGEYLQLLPQPEKLLKISGKPMTIKLTQPDTQIDARAEEMQYQLTTQQLELTKDIFFSTGSENIKAQKIFYNGKTKQLSAPPVDKQIIELNQQKSQPKNANE